MPPIPILVVGFLAFILYAVLTSSTAGPLPDTLREAVILLLQCVEEGVITAVVWVVTTSLVTMTISWESVYVGTLIGGCFSNLLFFARLHPPAIKPKHKPKSKKKDTDDDQSQR